MIGELKSRGFKRVLADSALAMLSPVIILGCIYTGVASPTEAAVISVFYALFISLFLYKSIQIKDLWGAGRRNPTPMNFSEVYIGLQQKTIDAQENPCEVIVSNRLYEQQDYVIETNHLPHLISLIVSEKSALYTSHFPIATPL